MKTITAAFYIFLYLILFTGCSLPQKPVEVSPAPPTLTISPVQNPEVPTETHQAIEPTLTEEPPIVFSELSSIALLNNTALLASPSHSNSFLQGSSIKSGEPVYVLGRDKDSAWLLVIHKKMIGWVPSLYSSVGVGTMNSTLLDEGSFTGCSSYLDTLTSSKTDWESTIDGSATVRGYLYHSPSIASGDIAISLMNSETGKQLQPELTKTAMGSGGEFLTFAVQLDDLHKGNHISYVLNGASQRAFPLQVSFYSKECSTPVPGEAAIQGEDSSDQEPSPLAVITIVITSSDPSVLPIVTEDFDWSTCHASYKTRLRVGAIAYVSKNPPYPNNVRDRPYVKGTTVLGKIQPGQEVKIIKGPSCSSGWVWWKVTTLDGSLTGWTAEGDANAYWLVPSR